MEGDRLLLTLNISYVLLAERGFLHASVCFFSVVLTGISGAGQAWFHFADDITEAEKSHGRTRIHSGRSHVTLYFRGF